VPINWGSVVLLFLLWALEFHTLTQPRARYKVGKPSSSPRIFSAFSLFSFHLQHAKLGGAGGLKRMEGTLLIAVAVLLICTISLMLLLMSTRSSGSGYGSEVRLGWGLIAFWIWLCIFVFCHLVAEKMWEMNRIGIMVAVWLFFIVVVVFFFFFYLPSKDNRVQRGNRGTRFQFRLLKFSNRGPRNPFPVIGQ
jgi:hypothetical protein